MEARADVRSDRIPFSELARRSGIALLVLGALPLFAWPWFELRVAAAFERADRSAPVRVYARPAALGPGARVQPAQLEAYLAAAGYRSVSGAGSPEALAPGEHRPGRREWWIRRRPVRWAGTTEPAALLRVRLDGRGAVVSLRDGEGRPLERALLEPPLVATFGRPGGRDRFPVPLAELPDHLVEAVLAVEDRRFREHGGLDLRRIAAASLANLRAGRVTQGGSTLTQQLARTLFLSRERSLLRKLREAAAAVALERRLTKDEILEAYLNHIYMGHAGGRAIHGVGRAALHYLGKDASQLEPGESALLAGLIRAPNLYSPGRDTAAARGRRDLVLRRMARLGRLDGERLTRELARPVPPPPAPAPSLIAPYYVDRLREELAALLPEVDLATAGLTVASALRPGLQAAAEAAVARGLERLERAHPRPRRQEGPLQAALVALDPRSGEILAMVGGRDYGASQFDRASDARRQPGSVFKPVVALAALTRGEGRRYTLASLLEDEPLSVRTPAGPWRPVNYDGWFEGEVTLRMALEESRNVPFARLGVALGPERIVETARALGIRSDLRAVPSLALGSSEVTLLEITSAYGVLAAEGRRAEPRTVWEVLDADGCRVGPEPAAPRRAFEPAEAYVLTSALQGAVDRGTGRGVRSRGFHGPVAAKSGTTNGYRDAWFVGYTPELAVGVWVGFDDGTPVGRPGAVAALPIFTDFLRAALGPDGGSDFRMPPGVEVAWVDPWGARAGWGCYPEREVFLAGTAPRSPCTSDWPSLGRAERGADRRAERQGAGWAEAAARALAGVERWLREWADARLERPVAIGGGGRR